MAAGYSIAPFPTHIDRDAFGHWLSGFVDGEGCFSLVQGIRLYARFEIKLRQDDAHILALIRSYLQVGCFWQNVQLYNSTLNWKPQAVLKVTKISDLASVIIPHFERCPLRAKKAADFAIWKDGVFLLRDVQRRKHKTLQGPDGRILGRAKRYTRGERRAYGSLVGKLQDKRVFKPVIR